MRIPPQRPQSFRALRYGLTTSLCLLALACGSSGSSSTGTAADTAAAPEGDADSQASSDSSDTAAPPPPGEHNPGDISCHEETTGKAGSRDIVEWTSTDGTTFTKGRLFQYCADVPSLAQSPEGTILAAFQAWVDKGEDARWDKIALRRSDDNGASWGEVTFAIFEGLPGSGRPFDPTIAWNPQENQWRMYFSLGMNGNMLDNTVCTHSASSTNGIDFVYESGERYCAEDWPVIDPATLWHEGTWYYVAPIGAPQDGAHFATSSDGLTFTAGPSIPSDMKHNWTGNLASDGSTLRFYAAEGQVPDGNFLWWASTDDQGATWSDYTRTNVPGPPAGKDPAVLHLNDGSWLLLVPGDSAAEGPSTGPR